MSTTGVHEIKHPLGRRLHSLGVTKAAIIDDAYDTPTRASFDRGEIPDFWGAIERDEQLVGELRALDPAVNDADSINDALITALWERRNDGTVLSRHAREQLFATTIQGLEDLEVLETHLRALSLDIERLGSGLGLPEPTTKLVFIDYFLGPSADSVKTAKLRARQTYYGGSGDDKPFIVLMSSESAVEQAKEQFRDDSQIIAGLFDFVHKPVLKVATRLYVKLATWALGMRERHDIQRFVDALDQSVKELSDRFMGRVRSLGLEDYAYLQKLKLSVDGHPLGDYMLWLFGSLLPHLAFDADKGVSSRRAVLDAMGFTELLPGHWKPARELAEIYRLAVSEPAVEKLGPHPLDHSEPESQRLPWLRLGDLFVNESGRALMVANAACSIAFMPGTSRDDPDRYVVLIPGSLRPIDSEEKADDVTEPFQLPGNDEVLRIIWDCRRPTFQRHGEITQWLQTEKFERKARLRLPYALQLQQAYQNHQLRVGTPVAPPRFEAASLEMWHEGSDGKCTRLGDTLPNGVRIIDVGDDKQFVLNVDAVSALLADIEIVISRQATKLVDLQKTKPKGWEGRAASTVEKVEQLRKLAESPDDWRALLKHESRLPKGKTPTTLVKGVINVWCNGDFSDAYGNRPPVSLNIVTSTLEGPSVEPRAPAVTAPAASENVDAPASPPSSTQSKEQNNG